MNAPIEIKIPDIELEGFSESAARRVEAALKRELELGLSRNVIHTSSKVLDGAVIQLSEKDISNPSRLGKALAGFILSRARS